MTYCCNHARRASELMDNANSELSWSDNLTGGDAFMGGFTLGAWSTARLASNLDEAQRRIRAGREYIRQAQQELRSCNCEKEKEELKKEKELLLGSVVQQVVQLAPNGKGEFEHRIEERNDYTGDFRNRIWIWRKSY